MEEEERRKEERDTLCNLLIHILLEMNFVPSLLLEFYLFVIISDL